jgi:hypothetical protein
MTYTHTYIHASHFLYFQTGETAKRFSLLKYLNYFEGPIRSLKL